MNYVRPVISAADSVFVMDDDSFDLYEKTVRTGGKMILNQDSITRSFSRNDIDYIQLPLAELAIQAGSIKCANMVGLGGVGTRKPGHSAGRCFGADPKANEARSG